MYIIFWTDLHYFTFLSLQLLFFYLLFWVCLCPHFDAALRCDFHHHQSKCIVTFWAKNEGNCAVCNFVFWSTQMLHRDGYDYSETRHISPSTLRELIGMSYPQAGHGVYELMDRTHPGGGATFTNLCNGKGLTPGKPLKVVNGASRNRAHPYVLVLSSAWWN